VPIFGVIDVRKAYEHAMSVAKIDRHGVTPYHTARHTLGTLAATKTSNLLAVQRLMRHRSLRMTETYAHGSTETDRGSKLLSCLVEHDGIEPSTSAMPLRRSPS